MEYFSESYPCGALLYTATLSLIHNYLIRFAALASVPPESKGSHDIDFKEVQVSAAFPSTATTYMQEHATLGSSYLVRS